MNEELIHWKLEELQAVQPMKQVEEAYAIIIVPMAHNSNELFWRYKLVLTDSTGRKIVGATSDSIDFLHLYNSLAYRATYRWSIDILKESKCTRILSGTPFYIDENYLSDCWIAQKEETK
jgi:hypothetical protein